MHRRSLSTYWQLNLCDTLEKKKNVYFCHILNRPISPHKLYLELLKNLYPESLKELWIIYLNILERTMMKYGQTEAPTEMAGLHIQY